MEIFPRSNKEKRMKMKRLINFFGRIFSIFIIVFIFFHGSAMMKNMGDSDSALWSPCPALAQPRPTEAAIPRDETKAASLQDSSLMHNLLEKQKDLDNREKALKEEEARLEALKKDVAEKMEALRILEERMSPSMESQKAEKDKKYQSLAKIYEATPPEKAAAIFEKMDRKMAAEIMLRMNSKKAGAIWAHINHEAGVQIAREMTYSQSVDTAKATRIAKEITGAEVAKPEVAQSPESAAAKVLEGAKGVDLPKPETRQSLDRANAAEAARETAAGAVVKPEASQKASAKSTEKKGTKIAKSKRAKPKDVQAGASKPFAIQIKAVRGIEMATEFAKVLKNEGIDAYWSEMSTKGGGSLYRILVGRFVNREEAEGYMKEKRIDIDYPGSYILKNERTIPKQRGKKK